MNVKLLRRIRKHLEQYDCPPEWKRQYTRKWLASVRHLGDRWLLAVPQHRN